MPKRHEQIDEQKSAELRFDLLSEIQRKMRDPEFFMRPGFISQLRELACMLGMVTPTEVRDGGEVLFFDQDTYDSSAWVEPNLDTGSVTLISRNRLNLEVPGQYSSAPIHFENNTLGDLVITPADGYSIEAIRVATSTAEQMHTESAITVGLEFVFAGKGLPRKVLKMWLQTEDWFMPTNMQVHNGFVFKVAGEAAEPYQFAELLTRPKHLTVSAGYRAEKHEDGSIEYVPLTKFF